MTRLFSSKPLTKQQIEEAIEFHLEGLRIEGLAIAEPTTICDYVECS